MSRLSILLPVLLLFTGCLFEDKPAMSLPDADGDGVLDLDEVQELVEVRLFMIFVVYVMVMDHPVVF